MTNFIEWVERVLERRERRQEETEEYEAWLEFMSQDKTEEDDERQSVLR